VTVRPRATAAAGSDQWVALIGVASACIYLTQYTLRWPLWQLYQQPYLDYAWLSQYTRAGQAAYLGLYIVLFGLQYAAYLIARADPRAAPRWLILGGQLLFGLLLVGIYPVAALDVYDYLMYGRIALVYGGNPFTQPPSAFPDPLVGFSPWPNEPSVYGPVWQLISLVPTALSGGNLLAGLVAFKLTALGCYLGCSMVLWRLIQLVEPDLAPAGTLLFAWNPLLLFELAGNAHNDGAMVLLVLLAILSLVRGPRLLVLPLLAAAILTKLLAAALGPVFLVGLLRAPGHRSQIMGWVVGGGALALSLTGLLYLPFWEGIQTLHFLTRGNWFTASFPTMLREYFRLGLDYEVAGRTAATLVAGLFALYIVARLTLLGWADRRAAPGAERVGWGGWLGAAHDVTFVYLAFACIWWEPWYLTWLVALAALQPDRLLHERALLFCYGGVVNYAIFKYVWPVYQPMTYTQIMGLSVVAIFGLPLLHVVCTLGLRGQGAGRALGGHLRGSGGVLEASGPYP